jgi:prepilin-type N-terminal cleavage/methylation domain-containing protein/prepilin-type processing-associated H-X9-DG protein
MTSRRGRGFTLVELPAVGGGKRAAFTLVDLPAVSSAKRAAFTLVELLVVVGIIAVLAAFLFPSLKSAREKAQRTMCANRLRQLAAASISYGTENHGRLPRGNRDGDDVQHCIYVSHETYNVFLRFLGRPGPTRTPGQNPSGDPALACPNLYGNDSHPLPYDDAALGWVIGYNYLGDHKMLEVNNHWVVPSPVRLTDRGSLPLFSDLNDWSPRDRWTIVPHQKAGGGGYFFGDKGGLEPDEFGAAGGNVAFLDGSVRWKASGRLAEDPSNRRIDRAGEMLEYYTYGSPEATDVAGYRGLW